MSVIKTDKSVVNTSNLRAAFKEGNSVRLYYAGGDTTTIYDENLLAALGDSPWGKCGFSNDTEELIRGKSGDDSASGIEISSLAITGDLE